MTSGRMFPGVIDRLLIDLCCMWLIQMQHLGSYKSTWRTPHSSFHYLCATPPHQPQNSTLLQSAILNLAKPFLAVPMDVKTVMKLFTIQCPLQWNCTMELKIYGGPEWFILQIYLTKKLHVLKFMTFAQHVLCLWSTYKMHFLQVLQRTKIQATTKNANSISLNEFYFFE